jgi:muramoyltetrapeptide carboxypeptidase
LYTLLFQNNHKKGDEYMFKKIDEGCTIGIVSPAYIPNQDNLISGVKYLQNRTYNVRTGENIDKEHGYFAGTEEQRLDDLHDMYTDPGVKMIFCTRGGWGGLRMIDRIGYQLIAENPKPLIGYSDITTLQMSIYRMTGVPSISGPMVSVEFGKGIHPFTEEHFWGQVLNKDIEYVFNWSETKTIDLKPGRTDGILLGGCLSMICGLLGTPYCPDFTDTILFIEDVGEKPYKIDRYLAQLRQAGVFNQIQGLILGEFLDCEPDKDETSFTVDEILMEYFSNAKYPVLMDFPYGHGDIKFSMPIGMHVKLDTRKETLTIANPFYNDDPLF